MSVPVIEINQMLGLFPAFAVVSCFRFFSEANIFVPQVFPLLCPFQKCQQSPSRNLLIFMSRYVKAIIIILYAGVMINIILLLNFKNSNKTK